MSTAFFQKFQCILIEKKCCTSPVLLYNILMDTRCYFNLQKKKISVQKKINGVWRVVRHADSVALDNVTFRVSKAGRERVLQQKRKNVHAYICGTESGSFNYYKKLTAVNYNPYLFDYFYENESGNPVTQASAVLICGKKIIIIN